MTTNQVETKREQDRQLILKAYRSLMRDAYSVVTDKHERKEIRRAFEYSVAAHEGIRRKNGEPYILHPIAVAKIVIKEIGLGATSIISALLHDVVEDTEIELTDIRKEFGAEVAVIIDGLTKISDVFDDKTSAQAENFRKMLLTLNDDVRVILIKLADRLHNMRTLEHMKKTSQLKIASETLYLYAPMAHRLGLSKIKHELEDIALQYTEPEGYKQIHRQLVHVRQTNRYQNKKFMDQIKNKLREEGVDFTILQRYKSIYSIHSKIKRQGISFDEIFDLFAIRIIIKPNTKDEKAECWRVYSILTQLFHPNPERLRDWLTIPKTNGYEALHVTLMGPRNQWVEVQIRSERMDLIAERGVAAHWRYKEGGQRYDDNFVIWLSRVRELLENPSMNAVEVIKEFQTDLISDEVIVFTPRGDLIQLPKGATVLDFAYEIHTGIGNGCIGAKVNHKVVAFSYKLKNGDQIEIISSAKQNPKAEWLQYAKTSKARNRIREALKKQKKVIAEKGREIFSWKMRNYPNDKREITNELLTFFNVPTELDFFYLLGKHKLDMNRLAEFIQLKKKGIKVSTLTENKVDPRKSGQRNFEERLKEQQGVNSDMLLISENMDISGYKLSPCCNPVPGDDIIGIMLPEGLMIHRPNCSKAISAMSNWGRNIIKAKWNQTRSVTFLAGIKIKGTDSQGMMNSLIKIISNRMKLNIRSITIDSKDEVFEGIFKVFVQDTTELENLRQQLKDVEGVSSVTRLVEDTSQPSD